MTDRAKFTALMAEFGVSMTVTVADAQGAVDLTMEAKFDTKVNGYAGFQAVWSFDAAGAFTGLGVWE